MKHSSSKTKERLVITIWQCKRSWKDLVLTGLVCCTVITGILGAIIGVKHPFFLYVSTVLLLGLFAYC
jgi:hypothetical protein